MGEECQLVARLSKLGDTKVMMDCDDKEGAEFLDVEKSNNILVLENNCLVVKACVKP